MQAHGIANSKQFNPQHAAQMRAPNDLDISQCHKEKGHWAQNCPALKRRGKPKCPAHQRITDSPLGKQMFAVFNNC